MIQQSKQRYGLNPITRAARGKRRLTSKLALWTWVLLVTVLTSPTAWADGTATLMSDGDSLQLAWQDGGAVRIDTPNESAYMIARDGKLYSVVTLGQKSRVLDVSSTIRKLMASGKMKEKMSFPITRITRIQATGETATVADIEGRVYQVEITDSDGNTETKRIVLTDDPQVVAMTQALLDAMLNPVAPDVVRDLESRLPADDRGLLQSGDKEMRLTAISDKAPPASRFELPAKPLNMDRMMQQMMQKMQQQ